jgi:hypothetical protein
MSITTEVRVRLKMPRSVAKRRDLIRSPIWRLLGGSERNAGICVRMMGKIWPLASLQDCRMKVGITVKFATLRNERLAAQR